MKPSVSVFLDANPRGFGLLQRDRNFSDYEDLGHLSLRTEGRATGIEPHEGWGEGRVGNWSNCRPSDETNDNIVVGWKPKQRLDVGKSLVFGYRITAMTMDRKPRTPGGLHGRDLPASPRALWSAPDPPPAARAGGAIPHRAIFPAATCPIT